MKKPKNISPIIESTLKNSVNKVNSELSEQVNQLVTLGNLRDCSNCPLLELKSYYSDKTGSKVI
jgi:hypothetical protein